MSNNAMLQDFDSLMDASMDDIDDLPPIGVPPSGSYDMTVTASREKPQSGGNDYIKLSYEITNVNEVKDEAEATEVKAGQKFTEMFSPFKKDGTVNEIGLGSMKERLKPFAGHFGTSKISEIVEQMQQVNMTASLTRTADKKEEGRFRFRLKDVVVL
jgi:hypothetical protein